MVLSKQISVSVRSTITMSVSKISPPSCSRQNTAHRWSSTKSNKRGGKSVKHHIYEIFQQLSFHCIIWKLIFGITCNPPNVGNCFSKAVRPEASKGVRPRTLLIKTQGYHWKSWERWSTPTFCASLFTAHWHLIFILIIPSMSSTLKQIKYDWTRERGTCFPPRLLGSVYVSVCLMTLTNSLIKLC